MEERAYGSEWAGVIKKHISYNDYNAFILGLATTLLCFLPTNLRPEFVSRLERIITWTEQFASFLAGSLPTHRWDGLKLLSTAILECLNKFYQKVLSGLRSTDERPA